MRNEHILSKGKQFLKFGMVGVGNIVVYFLICYLLLWLDINYLLASAIAWAGSVLHAFFWNRRYVFSFHGVWWKALFKSYVSYSASFLVGLLLMLLLVEQVGISKMWAPWMTFVITVPLNYILNKFWAFTQN